jgi:hypothetical protein
MFFPMADQARENGGGWWAMQVAGLGTRTVPACCVGAFPILEEIKAVEPKALDWPTQGIAGQDSRTDEATPERNVAAKNVFQKPRPECDQWFQNIPGLSPEKHLELRNMQRLERESARRDADSARRDRRSFWAFVFIGIVGLILAIAQVWAQLQGNNITVSYPPVPIQSTPDKVEPQP